jgi:hypothetical protein
MRRQQGDGLPPFPGRAHAARGLFVARAPAEPAPDLDAWRRIGDPRRRAEVARTQLYDYFRRTEAGGANVLRDAELAPLVREMAEERRLAYLRQVRNVLVAGWRVRGTRRALLRAVLGLAVDFRTWQTLARREGLDDRTAVALMVHLTACVGGR